MNKRCINSKCIVFDYKTISPNKRLECICVKNLLSTSTWWEINNRTTKSSLVNHRHACIRMTKLQRTIITILVDKPPVPAGGLSTSKHRYKFQSQITRQRCYISPAAPSTPIALAQRHFGSLPHVLMSADHQCHLKSGSWGSYYRSRRFFPRTASPEKRVSSATRNSGKRILARCWICFSLCEYFSLNFH